VTVWLAAPLALPVPLLVVVLMRAAAVPVPVPVPFAPVAVSSVRNTLMCCRCFLIVVSVRHRCCGFNVLGQWGHLVVSACSSLHLIAASAHLPMAQGTWQEVVP
jgi:hypothetical protein